MFDQKDDVLRKIKELAYPMIGVQMEERRIAIQREIGQVVGEMAGRGIVGSSFGVVQDLCGREIEARALYIWRILHRILANLNVRSTEISGPDLKEELRNNLPVNDLKVKFEQASLDVAWLDQMPYSICSVQEFERGIQVILSVGIEVFFGVKISDPEKRVLAFHSYMISDYQEQYRSTKAVFPKTLDEIAPETLFE